ncbi:MAG: hypothetical protein COU44_02495 [Candidatus Nealsonbacteria bacterium CG10_big_fil_rev_8_21_14_0_10_40_24]|nr:MAG: hypothetical protein COU44_02495 [Candidatus Nealsonbacteria bacterium CG10_big_fil_rev_8_21_14_0_10_40_24]
MKKRVVLVVFGVLVLVGVLSKAASAEWFKGIVHFHSKYSDGTYNLDSIWQGAQKHNVKFIFMTEHADCFGQGVGWHGVAKGHLHDNNNPYDDYISRCYWLSGKGSPLMIGGFEFPLKDTSLKCHALVLAADKEQGENSKYWYLPEAGYDEIMFSYQVAKRAKALESSVDFDFSKDYIPVIVLAHPSLWNPPFDFDKYKEKILTNPEELVESYPEFAPVATIETFNGSSDEQKDLDLYMKFLQNNLLVGVTCGNDSHGVDTDGYFTFINADKLATGSLTWAISRGNTYASIWEGQLEGLSYQIGTDEASINTVYQKVDFNFRLVYPRPINDSKTIVLYRDGVEVPDSRRTIPVIPLVTREVEYSFTDQVKPGAYNYVIYSPGQLITSPIQIYVDEMSEEERKALEESLNENEGAPNEPSVNIVLGQNDPYQWLDESYPKDRPKYYTNRFYWQSCVYAYLYFANLSPGLHTWKTVFIRPDGSVSCSTDDSKYINSYDEQFSEVIYFKPSGFDFDWVSGTWRIKFWLDGELVQTVTYENIGDGFK